MSIFTSNAAAVNQGQSIITCTDNSDFSGVPSGSVVIINNDHLAVVDSGTAANSNNSTLTLRSPWPSDLPDITAGKLFVLAGAPAIAEAVKSTLTVSQTLTTTKQELQAIIDAQGTAATADLTTGTLDTTLGRALRVGDYGSGLEGILLTDANTALVPAIYRASGGDGLNFYGGFGRYGFLEVFRRGDRIWQRNTFQNDVATRYSEDTGATWSDWDLIASAANNSLIEYGSNANGSYTKFPDGTLNADKMVSVTNSNITSAWGSLFRGGDIALGASPFPFVGTPTVEVTIFSESTSLQFFNAQLRRYVSNSDIGYSSAVSATSLEGVNYHFHVTMKGRWK